MQMFLLRRLRCFWEETSRSTVWRYAEDRFSVKYINLYFFLLWKTRELTKCKIMKVKSLQAYQYAFELAMEIFEITKVFPKEEKYSITDQVRTSSRSVCICLAEGYRKRSYFKYFLSKISDADMENSDTQIWLEFALNCQYLDDRIYARLITQTERIGRLIGFMLQNPGKFI